MSGSEGKVIDLTQPADDEHRDLLAALGLLSVRYRELELIVAALITSKLGIGLEDSHVLMARKRMRELGTWLIDLSRRRWPDREDIWRSIKRDLNQVNDERNELVHGLLSDKPHADTARFGISDLGARTNRRRPITVDEIRRATRRILDTERRIILECHKPTSPDQMVDSEE